MPFAPPIVDAQDGDHARVARDRLHGAGRSWRSNRRNAKRLPCMTDGMRRQAARTA
jgi:hypothetical protein